MSDHLEGKLKVDIKWMRAGRVGWDRKFLEERDKVVVVEYQEKIDSEWNRVKERESGDVEEKWQIFKCTVVGCGEQVCVGTGVRVCVCVRGRWSENRK